jgi:uncharacterized membrane protein HdeD (DUF308 family)
MLFDGVLAITAAVRAAQRHERWGIFVIEGVADLVAGGLALAIPGAALFAFLVLAIAWAIVSGVLMLAGGLRLRTDHGRAWLVVGGAASIVWGVLLGIFPAAGLVVLTWWLGAYALVFGVSLVALAFALRRRRGGAAGAASAG